MPLKGDRIRILLFASSLWVTCAAMAWSLPAADLYDGIAAYEASDYEQAETILRGLDLESLSDVEQVMARKYLAVTLLADERREEAEKVFMALLEIEPEYALDSASFAPDVRATFDNAKRRLADRLHDEGVEALRAERTERAVELFESVLALDPGHPTTQDFLAIARAKAEEEEDEQAAREESSPKPLMVTEIRPSRYRLGVLERGELVYFDREFRFEEVPAAYHHLITIQTSNDDKDAKTAAVSFSVDQDVEVYVAHDQRVIKKPGWLGAFRKTGDTLVVLESAEQNKLTVYDVYVKDYSTGVVTLGENFAGRVKHHSSMYVVFLRPRAVDR